MGDVEFERRDGLALVTLSRPDRLNAVTHGLIAEMADEGGDLDAALALAAELLTRSPFGLRHTKELLNLSLDTSGLRGHLAVENRTQTLAFFTEDLAEGFAATMEKREPRFHNR